MRTKITLIFIFMAFFLGKAWAHPPSDIKLSYDTDTDLLHVSLRHISSDARGHRIRKITVFKNDQEYDHQYFTSQTSGEGLEADIYVKALKGDVIRIKAVCSEAGFGEAEITIP